MKEQPLLKKQDFFETGESGETEIAIKNTDQSLSMHIYLLLNKPESSLSAKIVCNFIIFSIMLSISLIIIESVKEIRDSVHKNIWMSLNFFLTSLFTVEYFMRLFVCKKGGETTFQFLTSFINICDLLTILPFYIELFFEWETKDTRAFRILRLIRIIRMFKLGHYSYSIKLFWQVWEISKSSIYIFVVLLLLTNIFFANIVYIFEAGKYNPENNIWELEDGQETKFCNIPTAMWWALVTLSTVGYGDMYPKTTEGKFIGALTIIAGMLVIVLPIGIICNEAVKIYDQNRRKNHKNKQMSQRQMLKNILTNNLEIYNPRKEVKQPHEYHQVQIQEIQQQNLQGINQIKSIKYDLQKVVNSLDSFINNFKKQQHLEQNF